VRSSYCIIIVRIDGLLRLDNLLINYVIGNLVTYNIFSLAPIRFL
jgi:hypothetical protein